MCVLVDFEIRVQRSDPLMQPRTPTSETGGIA